MFSPKKQVSWFVMGLSLALVLTFQNCSQQGDAGSGASTGQAVLDSDDVSDDPHSAPVYVQKTQVNQITANRILTANFFISIFGPTITNTVATNIAHQPNDFGSSLSVYDSAFKTAVECNKAKNIYKPCSAVTFESELSSNVGLNIRREALRLRTCHSAIKSEAQVLHALRKIASTATVAAPPALDEANLDKAYQLFFRAKPLPDAGLMDALEIVGHSEKDKISSWRAILLTLCLSPHWQVL